MYDVAVIGGGPIGSHVAFRLAVLGYEVVVVERKTETGGPVCCTGIVSRECVSSLALDKDVVFRQANGARLLSPSGRVLRLWRPEPQVSIVDRTAFNVALANRAQGQGVEYRLNSSVVGAHFSDNGVSLEFGMQGNGIKYLQARAVVIAAGAASAGLAVALGLGKVGDFAMGAQAEVEIMGVDEVEVYFGGEITPGFFAWLVPISSQKALVGLLSRRKPEVYLRRLLARLLAQGKIVSTKVEMTRGGIPLQALARTYGERLLVVGSAAGQVKPTTGGGIYYGLLCADIAANHLNRALKSDNLSAENLSSYQREWRKRLGVELRIGYWARKLYERLSDRQIDQVFDIIESNGIDEALLKAEDLSFDWHSKVVLRVMADKALSKAMVAWKIPFLQGKGEKR
ncbi:MAG: NAD(P)/FAD-dependent oxidoreductase [Dehalococcoidales bacterium]|nr:NAD(P)/FAD-dependent oxidoreductase [Dehalococcoidales bacterium]MDP7110238.1 NAD(P)/FAD-dependent oxidoreductase [Dehalococcoidales bacterium]MDP7409894.1 NAD(P)/FAD-dependent oxidoreductase [Dehalococcoidales bacterium]MDP7675471.1 NAD(P)/FAD-dependent oxidoreductase [Dehalococcoidales bacterium]HJM37147.1 NAD(P)/FAD-dependent oxidoreductase [Dehalococcoidales bacterium]